MSEFDRLNQGDPDMNLRVLVITASGETSLVPDAKLRVCMNRNIDIFDDYMSGVGLFGDETLLQERGRQRIAPVDLYSQLQDFY